MKSTRLKAGVLTLHIEINHSWRRFAQNDPVIKVGVFGYDGQTVHLGIIPNLPIRPAIIQIENMNVIRPVS